MKKILTGVAALVASTSIATAGGLDRTNQPMGILFEEGNYTQLSFGSARPSVGGTGVGVGALPAGSPYNDVAQSFTSVGLAARFQVNDAISLSVIGEQPYGADITYPGNRLATELGGTAASVSSSSITAIGRYEFGNGFSVHGGIRSQTISGDVTLSGLAYGGLNGYRVQLGSAQAYGYVVGAAYEIPAIALRAAITYNSRITHGMPTTETLGGAPLGAPSTTNVSSPESINFDFQTGLNEKTLLTANVRYARWSQLLVSPTVFDALVDPATPGSSISDLSDTVSWNVGLGRRLTDNFAMNVSLGYEAPGNQLVSPLAPSTGQVSLGIGGRYTMDNVTFSGGVRYTRLGDAQPETGTPDVARANFTGNSVLAVGLQVGVSF